MRVAVPPLDGSVQRLPCRSMASVRPSGETATDIDVPSWTVRSMRGGGAAGAATSADARPRTPSATLQRRMTPPAGTDELARILVCRCATPGLFFHEFRLLESRRQEIESTAARDHLDDLLAVNTAACDEEPP